MVANQDLPWPTGARSSRFIAPQVEFSHSTMKGVMSKPRGAFAHAALSQ